MNRLLEQLSEFCDSHRLEEKIFVAPSRAVGHQVAEALVRAGCPWINLHVETVHTLARGVISADLAREGLRLLSRAQALALIEQACSRTLPADGYFGRLKDQPGFHRAMRRTLEDLRRADVSPTNLRPGPFENGCKGRELRAISEAYATGLAENRFVDDAGVLHRAREKVMKSQGLIPRAGIYLLLDSLDLSSFERDFLKRLAGGRIQVLATDDPSGWKPTAASVRIFCALGEENEVREVFRRLLSDGIELDTVEILYTEGTSYLPLFYELSAQYGIPCTYAEGIPIVFSRPGQAVLGYLEWLGRDYDTNSLRRMIGADLVDFRRVTTESEPTGALRAARILRDAGVGWGRDRHLSCLDAIIQLYSERYRAESGVGTMRGYQECHARQISAARVVRSFIERLLEITPEADGDGKVALRELARGAATFVKTFARMVCELDGMASMALCELFAELSMLPEMRVALPEAIRRLEEAVKGTHVGASTPKPGHLHVSDCRTGGCSGRKHTFIVGMDESRHPGTDLEDPVLLDSERRGINRIIKPRRLPLLGERSQENKDALWGCLARLRGQITMSYSCRDLLEDRELFPTAMVLEIYRCVNDEPEADYTMLRSAMGTPAGFIPSRGTSLDETEWWLGRLRDFVKRGSETSAVVRAVYPWLEKGWQAGQERSGDRFTVFDGWVKDSIGELDPRVNREPVSCTQIEALARCPFAYFLRYVLEIEPPDDWARDPTLWLGAMEFGSLLHEIFRAFMTEVTAHGEKPSFTLHWARLKIIAEECINRWRRRVPPPNIAAFTSQRRHVLLTCQTFLKNEEIHCQRVAPLYFEVPFGMAGVESVAPIASEAPVSVDLGNGSDFLLRGRVDRVDHRGGDEYEVWDYKSGSTRGIREDKQFNRGRQIQHALYARAVEILLARIQKRGRVVRSGYFFPGPKGEGERIVKAQDTVALQRVLSTLFSLLRDGLFPYAPDSDFCQFCDYQCVCGGSEKANERSTAKPGNHAVHNMVLEPFWRLIDGEE